MMEALISGITLGLLLSISVGPVIFAIIKQSLNNGHKGGIAFIAGVSASDITFVFVCNFLTQLFQQAIHHKTLIGLLGSIFLILMGVYSIFFKKSIIRTEDTLQLKKFRKRDVAAIFFSGYLMNTLNPGVFLFWFAATAKILTQAQMQEHPVSYKITVFAVGLLFVLIADFAKVLLAGKLRPKLTPHNIHNINRVSGLILIGFGVALIWGLIFHGDKL